MNITGVILAAGKGSRMGGDIPKCCMKFQGEAIIKRIVNSCHLSLIKNIIVVVGYKEEYVRKTLDDEVTFVVQKELLGTGSAVLECEKYLPNDGVVIIINGDIPNITNNVINRLLTTHFATNNKLTFVTTKLTNPTGYGRVIERNNKYQIIEEKDLDSKTKKINEVNCGIYCVDADILFKSLKKLQLNEKSNEYYLTDIVAIISQEYQTSSLLVKEKETVLGVNTIEELKQLERMISLNN